MLKKRVVQFLGIAVILLCASGLSMAQRRVTFGRGRTSASVSGSLRSGAAASFVVRCMRGQLVTATVNSGNGRVDFGGSRRFSLMTDRNGDIFIDITNHGRSTGYTVTIRIR
jgi:hypothetical protein